MYEINNITLVCRLTKDPEMKETNSGKFITRMSIANNASNKEDGVSFFDVQIWGAMAESCNKYLSKGSQCVVTGRLQQDRWQDDTGNKRNKIYIVANSVQFIGSKPKRDSQAEYDGPASDDIPVRQVEDVKIDDTQIDDTQIDDSIPF